MRRLQPPLSVSAALGALVLAMTLGAEALARKVAFGAPVLISTRPDVPEQGTVAVRDAVASFGANGVAARPFASPTPTATPALLPPPPLLGRSLVPPARRLAGSSAAVSGDCNNDGEVTVDELIVGVNIALENFPPARCASFDVNGDEEVTIDELIRAVNIALNGPPPSPTPSPSPGPSPGAGLTLLAASSPANGAGDVAITRETILRFSAPLRAASVTTDAIHADFGGARLPTLLHMSPDGRTATLFYQPALPASARIRVTVDGAALRDASGRAVDADSDGQAGGVAFIDFDTLSLTTLPGTAVSGRVFASELKPGDSGTSVNVPLQGVTISVDGMEDTLRAVTDQLGNFHLEPAPLGRFFVHIDGRTATNGVPPGAYYPFVGKAWVSVAGVETNIGEIYLPLVAPGTLQPVSATQETEIRFPPSVLADFPEFADVKVMVPANSLYSDDGTRGGMVGIAPVPPDRIPGPLPPGLEFPIVITVQTDGAANFDKPVPVCFPNLPDPALGVPLAPGEKNFLYSFNHDTGEFEPVGSMTVSTDGLLICTDPGAGILAPGWHGSGPPPAEPPSCQDVCCPGTGGADGPAEGGGGAGEGAQCPACNDPGAVSRCIRSCEQFYGSVTGVCKLEGCYEGYRQGMENCRRIADDFARGVCSLKARDDQNNCQATCDLLNDACKEGCAKHSCGEGSSAPALAINPRAATRGRNDDPRLLQVLALLQQSVDLLAPYQQPNGIPTSLFDQLAALLDQVRTIAGDDPSAFLLGFAEQVEDENADFVAGETGNAPRHSIQYAARLQRPDGELVLRGETGPFGQYSLFVPRDGVIRFVDFYDPSTKQFGRALAQFSPNAQDRLRRLYLLPVDARFPDSDADGLADVVEFVYGTDPTDPDSDDDGVRDGAEVDQGTNPLDGRPVRTGIVATADTPGSAVDVCALNDLAAVADSNRGVSVFNVFNGMDPTIIAQVDTPGSAQAVACAGGVVAVADGAAGLAVIDISDPPAARITHQVRLGGSVQAVAAAGGVAYVGLSSGQLAAVDLASGLVLARLTFPGAVEDVALAEDQLFVLTSASSLFIHRALADGLDRISSIPVFGSPSPSEVGRKLFVGGGLAYVGHRDRYSVIDVRTPATPVLIGSPSGPQQLSTHDIAANGSGLVVATTSVRGPETLAVSLYDGSDPTDVSRFLTSFDTPGDSRGLSLFNGLAYVADGAAGIQVVNYLAYDALGVPPAVTLSASFSLDPATAEEGKAARISANVTDDVQVRNVEFYVDGVKVATDGNFPFEHRFTTPRRADQPTFTVRTRATDTGGNATSTAEIVVSLTPDATAPRVTAVSPRDGALTGRIGAIAAFFNEPIDPATLTPAAFLLNEAGPDRSFDTGDDVTVRGGTVEFRAAVLGAFMSFPGGLPGGRYRAAVSNVADLAGNRLAAARTWTFTIFDAGIDDDGDCVPDALESALGLDASDPDSDGDGVLDGEEDFDDDGFSNCGEVIFGSDPANPDSDGDGIPDGDEDSDIDGLTDSDEIRRGTDPSSGDSDGDGWSDGAEVLSGSNPRDAASQPRVLDSGVPVSDTIDTAGEVDGFAFTVEAGERVVLQVANAGDFLIGACVEVLAGSGQPPIEGGKACGGTSARVDRVLPAGTYVALVSDNFGDQTGPYNLLLQRVREEEAQTLGSDQPVADTIEPRGDLDLYAFTLTTPERVVVQAANAGSFLISPCVEVLAGSGQPAVEGGKACGGTSARVDLLLPAGTYFVLVSENFDDQTGPYNLLLQRVRTEEATALTPGVPVVDTIDPQGDLDLYVFTLAAAEQVVVQALSSSISPCLEIIPTIGQPPLAGARACGAPAQVEMLPAGTYFVLVSERFDDETGNYTLLLPPFD